MHIYTSKKWSLQYHSQDNKHFAPKVSSYPLVPMICTTPVNHHVLFHFLCLIGLRNLIAKECKILDFYENFPIFSRTLTPNSIGNLKMTPLYTLKLADVTIIISTGLYRFGELTSDNQTAHLIGGRWMGIYYRAVVLKSVIRGSITSASPGDLRALWIFGFYPRHIESEILGVRLSNLYVKKPSSYFEAH